MSKYTLQILFNQPERTYRFNEEITGKIVLDAQTDLTCKKIWIDYGWRTHGQGNRDKGDEEKITILAEMMQFRSGWHREFPFTIKAPSGPVTYHGHIVNVDWYLTGHADIQFAPALKKEQDFVLLACESPDGISLGTKSFLKNELPSRSRLIMQSLLFQPEIVLDASANTFKDKLLSIMGFAVYLIIGLLVIVLFHSLPWYVIASIAVVYIGMYIGIPQVLKAIAKTRFDLHELLVEPSVLYLGELVTCRLKFKPKNLLYVDHIEVKLWADESATSQAGTQTNTRTYRVYEKSFIKKYADKVSPERRIHFECALPILLGAPATFVSANNSIKWFVSIKLKFSRWLAWEKKIPITVLPC